MDGPHLDLDEVFLDAVEAVVLAALERIGDDPEARFRFFRRLFAVAEEEAAGICRGRLHPPSRPAADDERADLLLAAG